MKFSFAQVSPFVAKWRRLGLTDEDLQLLEHEIAANPNGGKMMQGTGGLRKIRFAPPSWNVGKSGATRVCYVVFQSIGTIYLITMFTKDEKDNLSNAEKQVLRGWIKELRNAVLE